MTKRFPFSASLTAGACSLLMAGSAHAQQWYDATRSVPVAPPAGKAQESKDWNYTLGGGVGYTPTYEGSDEYDFIAVPVVNVEYKDGLFFANVRDGVGSYALRGDHYKLGASLGYASGWDEDDDKQNLSGMGDVEGSLTANLLAEYDFGGVRLSGRLATALTGDYGTTAEVKLGSRYPLTDRLSLSGSVGTLWADGEHMDNRFGVTAAQSAASGYGIYDAGSGIKSVGFSVGTTYRVSDRWNVNLTFRGDQLVGDAADSPIVKDDFVPALFLTTSYGF